MKSIMLIVLLVCVMVSTNAFHLPYGFFQSLQSRNDYVGPAKRAYYASKPYKREFNADDMMLRFGKRSDPVAFSPDMLSLRFGRK